ncbi:transcription factor E2F7 [Engraulis encrasicolus]|uniref:transcription factor E2F7 n=1 Tax=Engraulis encrasicolus TaxID=184585 RepID=UPI002FD59979
MMETSCLALKDLSARNARINFDDEPGRNDQKENVCIERRKLTPHKSDASSSTVNSKRGSQPPLAQPHSEFIHITPIKHSERAHPGEPWTPTANLKMLVNAASPDMRDREIRKTLFRPMENDEEKLVDLEEEEDIELDESCQFDVAEECGDDFEKRPSRKQKSLGLLCQKFLALYPDYPVSPETINISLDEVASSLGVERRRIYDIVNVLESLMLVSRMAKNQYVWHGRPRLCQTLQELHQQGRQQRYHLHMEHTAAGTTMASTGTGNGEASGGEEKNASAGRRKDKSLRIMSQKFVMLFLVSKTLTVTLETAAKILIEESQDTANHSKYKTKVRRLYDIANVLTSLSLIKKVHVREEKGRKPAFKWIGPADFHTADEESIAVSGIPLPPADPVEVLLTSPAAAAAAAASPAVGIRRERFGRHASFQVVPTSTANPARLTCSAPTTPSRDHAGHGVEALDFSTRRTGHSVAVCRLQFGDGPGLQTSVNQTPTTQLRSPGLTPLAVPIPHTEGAYAIPAPHPFHHPQAQAHPHPQVAYLPGLTQPSFFMLYGAPPPTGSAQGQSPLRVQGSPRGHQGTQRAAEAGEKRRRKSVEEEEEERSPLRKRERPDVEHSPGQATAEGTWQSPRASPQRERVGVPSGEALCREEGERRSPPAAAAAAAAAPPPASHYLYVPHSAAGLNFLLSGHSPGGAVTLSPGGGVTLSTGASATTVPSLAVPYVLVPSSALSSYPTATALLTGPTMGFNLPTMFSPANFAVVSPGAFTVAGPAELVGSPSSSTPMSVGAQEYPQVHGLTVPASPATAQRQHDGPPFSDPHTPCTPKEAVLPGSKAFFQTPGTLGGPKTTPVTTDTRKRGSAQRRLDISHTVVN